jgi:hypothetical protein
MNDRIKRLTRAEINFAAFRIPVWLAGRSAGTGAE